MPLCGGTSEAKPADAKIQEICNKVKPQVQQKAGQNFGVYTAKSYKTQVVAGTNYFIKIDVGGNKDIHIRVYQKLPCDGGQLELSGVQTNKNNNDPIEFF